MTFTPITSTQPASLYWGIDQQVSYGSDTTLLSGNPGIVDTGTTLLLLATDAFQAYQSATGATMDSATGLLTVTQAQFDALQSLFFTIGGTTFELTANAQIWPRAQNAAIGGEDGKIYLVAADLGTSSGQGLDFISKWQHVERRGDSKVWMLMGLFFVDGFVFLQRFYSVYDTGNSQVGLATTQFTDAETN